MPAPEERALQSADDTKAVSVDAPSCEDEANSLPLICVGSLSISGKCRRGRGFSRSGYMDLVPDAQPDTPADDYSMSAIITGVWTSVLYTDKADFHVCPYCQKKKRKPCSSLPKNGEKGKIGERAEQPRFKGRNTFATPLLVRL